MNSFSVSVIIITYNRLHFLKDALKSIHLQRLKPCEIIIVDDGSFQPVEKAFCYEARRLTDIPINFVRLKNSGPSAARNAGARCACGNVLAFLDDDDFWDYGYLQTAVKYISKHNYDLIITWLNNIHGEKVSKGKQISFDFDKMDLFRRNNGIIGSNIIVKKKAFDTIGGFDPLLYISEDKDFLIRMKAQNAKIGVIENNLVYYRIHNHQKLCDWSLINDKKISGKERFLKKYWNVMPISTRRHLSGEIGFFYLMGSKSISSRLYGLRKMIHSFPGYFCDAIKSLFSKLKVSIQLLLLTYK